MSSARTRALWRLAAALTAVLLCGFTCVSTAKNNTQPSPTPSPSPTPPPSPTQASTPASITGIPLPVGEVGVSYTASLGASGGATPYTWSIDSGALPNGLSLTSDGSVSGVPTTPGTFALTVKATDATNQYTTQGTTIKIAAALSATLIPACATACQVEQGCVNVCGIFGSQGGGVGPFKYQLLSGLIPAGNKLSGNGLNLVGTFLSVESYWQFTVQVSDSLGATVTISPTFNVYQHVSLASGPCSGFDPSGCTVRLAISGGSPNGPFSVAIAAVGPNPNASYSCETGPTPLPKGYGLSVSGRVVTVSIPGFVSSGNLSGYGAIWTLVVTDSSTCGANGTRCSSPGAKATILVQCG